mmetsp:Transcript_60622/g.132785  ORF Transcript_60622/g.132785 Transcript_60622/m.132785 type:complete len:289 (-) Transcript_60622:452-1318(-)
MQVPATTSAAAGGAQRGHRVETDRTRLPSFFAQDLGLLTGLHHVLWCLNLCCQLWDLLQALSQVAELLRNQGALPQAWVIVWELKDPQEEEKEMFAGRLRLDEIQTGAQHPRSDPHIVDVASVAHDCCGDFAALHHLQTQKQQAMLLGPINAFAHAPARCGHEALQAACGHRPTSAAALRRGGLGGVSRLPPSIWCSWSACSVGCSPPAAFAIGPGEKIALLVTRARAHEEVASFVGSFFLHLHFATDFLVFAHGRISKGRSGSDRLGASRFSFCLLIQLGGWDLLLL